MHRLPLSKQIRLIIYINSTSC